MDFRADFSRRMANPVSQAVMRRDAIALKQALEKSDNIKYLNPRNGWPPLHTACYNEDLPSIKVLLENDEVDITLRDIYGLTPIHIACGMCNRYVCNLEILEFLIFAFAEYDDETYYKLIDIRGIFQQTPLHAAVAGGNPNLTVPCLLKYGASAIPMDEQGQYPSHYCLDATVKEMLLKAEKEEMELNDVDKPSVASIAEGLSKIGTS